MRTKHMKAGAIIAQQLLERVKYNTKHIPEIVQLISTHDNAYLGIEQSTIGEKLIRDADACFILTELSFWKDYHVTSIQKGEAITPMEFLDRQVEKHSKRHTKSAQKITKQQIVDRKKEINGLSKTPLQRYRKLKSEAEKRNKEAI